MKVALACASCLLANLIMPALSFGADTLESWLPGECQYQGQFDQTRTLKALPQPLKSNGRFLFDCKAGMIWQTESPVSNTVIYTAKNVHFRINSSGKGKQLKGVVHNNMSTMLQALMGGDTDYLTRDFIAEPDADSADKNTGSMTFLPKSASVKRYLEQIRLEKKPGSMDITLINNPDENTHISTSSVTAFEASGELECAIIFGSQSLACTGLYFPAKLADQLQPGR